MKYLCTLSDWNYLAKGLALYESLKKTSSEPFFLFYLCLDDRSFEKLKVLNYSEIIPVSLREMEETHISHFRELADQLRTAKSNRPYNEYCWTLASYFCWHLIKWGHLYGRVASQEATQGKIDRLAYIDSDIYFYGDIEKFYAEVGTRSVGIIAHRHNAIGDRDGAYNVGVIYFKDDPVGRKCLFWWMDAVLNKKYPELQTCGDQKYLERFIPDFGADNVAVVDQTIGHGAPWNYRLYRWDKFSEGKIVWGSQEQPFLFNHFSRFSYDISNDTINFTSGKYGDHTLNGSVFSIPQIFEMYRSYYLELKRIHNTILAPVVGSLRLDDLEPLPEKAPAFIKPLKVSFGMIVLNGDFVLQQCLEAVEPFAHQILVAEGPVSYWQSKGLTTSTDRTNQILDGFKSPKLKIIHGQFPEKDAQCKAYMQFLDPAADYIWNLDSDEVYKPEDIEAILRLLRDEKYTSVGIRSRSFFGGFEHYITGFEEKRDNFLRVFKVYPGSTWLTHRPPTIVHQAGPDRLDPRHLDSDELFDRAGVVMWHYSYVYPRQVRTKVSYYKDALSKEKCIDDYYHRIYLPWVLGDDQKRKAIEDEFNGVHEWKPEYRGAARTTTCSMEHPGPIIRDLPLLKAEFDRQLSLPENQ